MAEAKFGKLFCRMPFDECIVSETGDVMVCCTAWLPISIGNLHEQPLAEIWNSPWALQIRASIHDGSFRYCIESHCPHLLGEAGPISKADEILEPHLRDIAAERKTHLDTGPRRIYIGYDPTCNLACPSCRCDYTVAKKESFARAEQLHERVFSSPLMSTVENVWISCNGDPFSSRIYREALRTWDKARFPNLRIEILTNGLLLTQGMWDSIRNSHGAIRQIQVSVNALHRDTVEEIQEGANYDRLMDNLRLLARLRREGAFEQYLLSFIVQARNFREMKDFIALAKELGADGVCFTSILNWGTFSDDEFNRRAIHRPGHPQHEELKALLADPVFNDPIVELGSLTPLHPDFARSEAPPIAAPQRLTLDELAQILLLSPEQHAATRRLLRGWKDALASLVQRRAVSGLRPLDLIRTAIADGEPESAWRPRFAAFMAAELEAESGKTFAQLMHEGHASVTEAFLAHLEQRQEAAFRNAVPVPLNDVDIGYDPIADLLAGHTRLADASDWDVLADHLNLDDAQAGAALTIIDTLKSALVALFHRPPANGGPSPLVALADALRRGDPDAQAQFLTMLRADSPLGDAHPYAAVLMALEDDSRQQLQALLRPDQRAKLAQRPLGGLPDLSTGYDPFGDSLRALVEGKAAGDTPQPRHVAGIETWDGLRMLLGLNPRQCAVVKPLIEHLQQAILQGGNTNTLEATCRDQIRPHLLRIQVLLLRKLPANTLSRLRFA